MFFNVFETVFGFTGYGSTYPGTGQTHVVAVLLLTGLLFQFK
jgi:hypothetical protein